MIFVPNISQSKQRNENKMIEYIKGELTELTPAMAVVEAGGVGYALCITLNRLG